MALRSITLPDLGEGRGSGFQSDPRTLSCSRSNSGLHRGQRHPSYLPYLMRWLREGCW